jgi:D-aminopeptidase
MTHSILSGAERLLATLPYSYPGPGGAVAVLHKGETLLRHSWGWANAERRIPFTPSTLFQMCSITKQFTCAVLLDVFPDPSVCDADVRDRLPLLEQPAPSALHLCLNQSGLRDYWAVAMLHGSPAEAPFGDVEAAQLIRGTKTLQFAPGSRYSYANQNFRILADILQHRTGRSFAELLRTRIFEPAGMPTAQFIPNTSSMPDGTLGYEGTPSTGFRPAVNNVFWKGDAGLGASLDDMIAWERFIDATRDEPNALYHRLTQPVTFTDGQPARYGFGLHRGTEFGREVSGHGGALRGWRCHRFYVPSERLSVVVMFNHLSDAYAAAVQMLGACLGIEPQPATPTAPNPNWLGAYREPETGLAVQISASEPGRVRLRFGHSAELLALQPDGSAGFGATRLRAEAAGLWMDRPQENQFSCLLPCFGEASGDVAGRYGCAELDAELSVVDAGGALYGGFSGFLGQGRMELLEPIGPDLWALPCPRALDHTPPGDWTLAFQRELSGRIIGVDVGCWLARGLSYARMS